jgi:cysteine-S-conjugate beta-lyase
VSTFKASQSGLGLQTDLIHEPGVDPSGFNALPHAVCRGSTTFFENTAAQRKPVDALGIDYSYGLHGNPTQYTLALQLAKIEQAKHCLLLPSGLTAIAIVGLALLRAGDHWCLPANAYGPAHSLARQWTAQFNIDFDVYDPMSPQDLSQRIRPNTRLIWMETPGSLTFEIPDIPALAAVARHAGIPSCIDNTWSSGLHFKPFAHGVDISIQALTKYQGGHADVIMGSVCSNNTPLFAKIELQNRLLGLGVSPEDCALVLRSLITLPLRHREQARVALELAQWIATQPLVDRLLHPAFASCPGHANWQRDFTGMASLFAFTLKPPLKDADAVAFVDALRVFHIGYSWGGPESLALAFEMPVDRQAHIGRGPLIRLAIGLEDPLDLKNDLQRAFQTISP